MTFSEGGERGVIRPGSRRNGSFQPAETRRWAEDRGIRDDLVGRATIRALGQGGEREGAQRGGVFRQEEGRMDLARTLLGSLEPGGELAAGNWSYVQDLERLAGVPEGSLDGDTALRAAQFMDASGGGPNLGAREAVAIAIAERKGEPRRSRVSADSDEVRRAFYGLGLGKAMEAAGDLVPAGTALGEGLTMDGVERGPDDAAVQAVRGKVRALDDGELRLARAVAGHGKKVGTSGRRNALAKESMGERVVGGEVPVLMARRTEQTDWKGNTAMEMPRVWQPREVRGLDEARKEASRDAMYAASPMERARAEQRLSDLRVVTDSRAYELNEKGKARRKYAIDPRAVRQLLVDPSAVLDPDALGLADDHPLRSLAGQYSQAEPVRDKTAVGSYEAVGAPNPEGWNTDDLGRSHGFSVPNDPGVPREAVWPTVGQAFQRALVEAETPVRTLVMGRRPVEPDFGAVQEYWNEAEVKPMVADLDGQLVIVQERDGRPVPGPEVFAVDQWAPEQGEGDEVFTRRYRVGENAKWSQERLGGVRGLVQALAEATGAPGDWRLVGDTGLSDPLINAAQNTSLQQTLGADSVSSRGSAVRGEFPERVERVGAVQRGTVYDNSLFTVLDTISRLGGRPADDGVTPAPVIAREDPRHRETWHDVVKPALEQVRETQLQRVDAAPGMWRFDEMKGGGIYPGVLPAPVAAAPTMAGVMGNYAVDQGGMANWPAQVVDGPEQILEVLRNPSRFDSGTVQAVQGWVEQNVQSPTRGEPDPGPSHAAPAARPVDVSGELGLNAVMGPGRYGDEVPIVATTGLGQVVRRAQAARDGVSLGAAGRPAPVEQAVTNQVLPSELARMRAQQIIKERGALVAAPSMEGMEWRAQERRPSGEYTPDPRASWLARRY